MFLHFFFNLKAAFLQLERIEAWMGLFEAMLRTYPD